MNVYTNKNIFITGGTGTVGSAFLKYLLSINHDIKSITIFSRDEYKQYKLSQEIQELNNNIPVRFIIGDVRDLSRLKHATNSIDYIVHTAALKHVPLGEIHPTEFIATNITGTQNVIEASLYNMVEKVIGLSTSKAVSPYNLYGSTKHCAEKLLTTANSEYNAKTKFSVLRFGNIFNSRGSVVPFFKEKAKTGTLPITDINMTRFTITLSEIFNRIHFLLTNMHGGEIYVPKSPKYKIIDLAYAISSHSKIDVIGPRPGEKIHEEIISQNEAFYTYESNGFYLILPPPTWNKDNITELKSIINPLTKVPNQFEYISNKTDQYLSIDQLEHMIDTN